MANRIDPEIKAAVRAHWLEGMSRSMICEYDRIKIFTLKEWIKAWRKEGLRPGKQVDTVEKSTTKGTESMNENQTARVSEETHIVMRRLDSMQETLDLLVGQKAQVLDPKAPMQFNPSCGEQAMVDQLKRIADALEARPVNGPLERSNAAAASEFAPTLRPGNEPTPLPAGKRIVMQKGIVTPARPMASPGVPAPPAKSLRTQELEARREALAEAQAAPGDGEVQPAANPVPVPTPVEVERALSILRAAGKLPAGSE